MSNDHTFVTSSSKLFTCTSLSGVVIDHDLIFLTSMLARLHSFDMTFEKQKKKAKKKKIDR